jgi:hypothetical protein
MDYFVRIPNVGDRINPSIVTAITGRPVTHFRSAGRREGYLVGIGSVMAGTSQMSQVWGTGVMHPNLGIGSVPATNVHALRGRLSHTAMRKGGVMVGDVPLGDPGYLAPRLLCVQRAESPKFRIGLAGHYVDRSNSIFRQMMKEEGVTDLDVHDPPDVFLRRIAECETVISSSLHGLIFAEALNIPNLWVKAGDEIAGGDFKFRDWFGTTRRPQSKPHVLSGGDKAAELAKRADIHESVIDVDDLMSAFPHRRLHELEVAPGRTIVPVDTCRTRPTPVFLISFNRGEMLKRVIASIRRLTRPTEIIVHDNGSNDPATKDVLDELEKSGIRIFRYPPIDSADELNRVNETVESFFRNWGEPARYVVSDCDIDMSIAGPLALDVYDELLNKFRKVASVGPMLRIRDIPLTYPLYNRVMNRHIQQFWQHAPSLVDTSFGQVAYLQTVIDTTFALHRAGEAFKRLKTALRVYEPFEAQHLDWYWDEADEDAGLYAGSSSSSVSHWNNNAELLQHRAAPLEFDSFHAVRRMAAGGLEIYKEHVSNNTGTSPRSTSPLPLIPKSPYSIATTAERAGIVAHIEALRSGGGSDVNRWSRAASHNTNWRSRGVALAQLVRSGEKVFEFGAGLSSVRFSLPPGCGYTASDLVPLTSGSVAYDLNASLLAPIAGHDVALFSGVLEYVHDLSRLAHFLAGNFSSVVCSYAVMENGSSEEIEQRRYSGWFTDFTESGFVELFTTAGFDLNTAGSWGAQPIFRFGHVTRNRM